MATRSFGSVNGGQAVEKLVGRENYSNWSIAMEAYLQSEGLWDTIKTDTTTTIDESKILKARGKIVLALDPIVYSNVRNLKTAKEIWSKLQAVYDDKGLCRKVNLLMNLTSIKLHQCESMNEYVEKIISIGQHLENINMKIPDELIGAILLAGLPAEYQPMILGLEGSGAAITADFIKTKLLSREEGISQNEHFDSAQGYYSPFKANPNKHLNSRFHRGARARGRGNRGTRGGFQNRQGNIDMSKVRCFICNRYGHYATHCDRNESKQQFQNKTSDSQVHYLSTEQAPSNQEQDNDEDDDFENVICGWSSQVKNAKKNSAWFLDSCASAHMCNNKDVMFNLKKSVVKTVTVANKSAIPVEAQGDVMLSVNLPENSSAKVCLKNVLYVPEIASNLVSMGLIDKSGCSIVCKNNKCEIINKNNITVATAILTNNRIYKLSASAEIQSNIPPKVVNN